MNNQETEQAIADLRSEVARCRRLALILAAPWLLVIFGSLSPQQSDVVTAQRFVVVDEHGVQRAMLAAPTELVASGFHSEAVPTSVPQLVLSYQDGRKISVGGATPMVRVVGKNEEWWAGLQASGFFTVQENESVSASTTISPFDLSVSVSGERPYRDITLAMFGAEDRPEIVITEGERESRVVSTP